jgi:hypothetical protein
MLSLYRRLLTLRRMTPSLSVGDQELLDGPEDVVMFERVAPNGQRHVVAVNMCPCDLAIPGISGRVVASTHGHHEHASFRGVLDADEAVIIADG